MDSEEYDYEYDAVGMYLRKPANPDGYIPGNDTFVDMEAAPAPVTEAELMQEAIRNAIPYPHVDRANPINERQDNEYLLTKCFPTLFPTGNGDYFQPFGVEGSHRKIDLKEYSSILLYHDFRFMKHLTFRYFIFNLQRRNFVHNFKNFVLSYTYDDITNNNNEQEFDILNLTAEQREEFMKRMKRATSDIPGTDGYWSKQLGDLISMVKVVGLPTFFITFSVADTRWTDVLSYIREVTGDREAGQFELVNTYVELTTAYLTRKFEAYFETFKNKWDIKDHWYRMKFQMRGAVHFHCLIWLEDAPDVSKLNEGDDSEEQIEIRRQIIDYFDQYVSAVFPNVEDMPERLGDYLSHHRGENVDNPEEDLRNQLACYQIHRCSDAYCLRKKAGSNEKKCRFAYPQNLSEQSHIAFDEKGRPTFVPKRNHSNLNNYNGFITGTWCANHDLQAVLSTDALLMYLAKYVAKAEKRSDYYNQFISQLQTRKGNARNLNANRAAMSSYTFVKKLCMKAIADRDCSACEVALINSKKPLVCMSRQIVTINPIEGSLPIEQRRYVRNENAIPALHKYMNRLQGVEDGEERRYRTGLSMYEMFQKYKLKYIPIQKRHLHEGRSFEWEKIENENEYKVVRVFPLIKVDFSNELFCKREILSRTPFVELPTYESFVDEYAIRMDNLRAFIDRALPQRDNEDEFEDEPELQANIIYDEHTAQVLLTHNLDEDDHLVIDDAQYEGPYTDSGVDDNPICAAIHDQGDALRFKERLQVEDQDHNIDEAHAPPIDINSLNEIQSLVFKYVSQRHPESPPLQMVVCGQGGSGKTHVFKALRQYRRERTHDPHGNMIMTAPTGLAAYNIKGKTIHSALGLKVSEKGAKAMAYGMASNTLRKFQDRFRNIDTVIIDEFSMIRGAVIEAIDIRLKSFKCSEDLFGGVNVIFLGDTAQLLSVSGTSCAFGGEDCNCLDVNGCSKFSGIEDMIELTQNMRQGDNPLREFCNVLRSGNINGETYTTLQQHVRATNAGIGPQWDDATHLFAKSKQCQDFNNSRLAAIPHQQVLLKAENSTERARLTKTNNAGGLENKIVLCREARVMLRRNVKQEYGLFNGAMGKVKYIHYLDPGNPSSLPEYIAIDFPDYKGPAWIPQYPTIVPIFPYECVFTDGHGTEGKRKQFPISLSYGMTIHKSQGLTLRKGILHLGDREFAAGLTYVAFSRFKRFEDVSLNSMPPYTRIRALSQQVSKNVRRRIRWEQEVLKVKSQLTVDRLRRRFS